jgi:adenylate cyclase
LAADVVGHSRLAGADEDCILARLRALRSDLIDLPIADFTAAYADQTERDHGTLTEAARKGHG